MIIGIRLFSFQTPQCRIQRVASSFLDIKGLKELAIFTILEILVDGNKVPVLHEMSGHIDNWLTNNLYLIKNLVYVRQYLTKAFS